MTEDLIKIEKSPIERLETASTTAAGINLFVKRDDLLNSPMQGNKFRKLKYNLLAAKEQNYSSILSFGGAFSNHLHALAHAGELHGLEVLAYVRADYIDPANPTIRHLLSKNVQIHLMSRSEYANKNDPKYLAELNVKHPDSFIIPEGGTNELAIKGAEELAIEILGQMNKPPDYCMVPVGSGGTIAGLIKGFGDQTRVIGISALKGDEATLQQENIIKSFLMENEINWVLRNQLDFGRFASMSKTLFDFIIDFKKKYGILLDPIYTSKMACATFQMITDHAFTKGSNVVMIHTGGLQGWDGMRYRFGDRYDFDHLF